jgi:hypothetical protein
MPFCKVWLSLQNCFSVAGIGQPLVIAHSPRLQFSYLQYVQGTHRLKPLSSTILPTAKVVLGVLYSGTSLIVHFVPINKPPSSCQSCGLTSILMQIYSSIKLNFFSPPVFFAKHLGILLQPENPT